MKLELESNNASLPVVNNADVDEMISDNNSAEITQMLRNGIEAAQKGDRADARTLLLRVTEADANNENAWLWLASISEYPEELLVFLKNVLNINPNNERAIEWAKATETLMAKTFVQRGIDAAKNEQKDFAKQCFLQAIVHDGKNELAWLWLASVSGSPEEKISHLQKVLSINPDNENALSSLKNAKSQMAESLLPRANNAAIAGNRKEALRILDEILHDSPSFEDGWMLKAHLAESFEEKMAYFEEVLEINPNNQVARANLDSLQMFVNNSANPSEKQEAEFNKMSAMAEDSADMDMSVQDLAKDIAEEIHQEKVEEESEPEQFVEDSVSQEMEMQEEKSQEVEQEEEKSQDDEMQQEFQEVAEEVNDQPEETSEFESQEAEVDSENEMVPPFEDDSVVLEVEQPMEATEEDFVSPEVNFDEVEQDYDSEIEEVEDYDLLDHSQESDSIEENKDNEDEDFAVDAVAEESVEAESKDDVEVEAESEDEVENHAYSMDELSPESEVVEQEYAEEEPVKQETVEPESVEQEFEATQEEAVESPVSEPEMPHFEVSEHENITPEALEAKQPQMSECPYCYQENGYEAFVCVSCRSILTLSDIEMLLSQDKADKGFVEKAIERMEADKNRRGVDIEELKAMGIGYINLKNYRKGFEYLKDAAKKNPDDIVFNSQVDALAVRIAEIEERQKEKDSSPKSKTILIVDDSPTIRKLISGKLEKCGHEAICAVDGMDALAKLNDVIPDLILLDITMPRMDGYQVCKLIRGNESTENVPIVMISGKDGFFDKVRGKMAGTDNYITKPFGPETLMKTVNAYIS